MRRRLFLVLMIATGLLGFSLPAYQRPPAAVLPATQGPTGTKTPATFGATGTAVSATPTASRTPTATLSPAATGALLTPPAGSPFPTPVPNPLRFNLPTPAPAPVSAWRPPLYPVPWALTENDHFYFARPIAADEVNWPLANYRYGHIFFGPEEPHSGVDIVAPEGTPVLAAGPGRVVWVGYGLYHSVEDPDDPYGLAVAILHDFGFNGLPLYTVYAHLSRADVVLGQHLETGEQLGLSGDTGRATGAHLHFEVRFSSLSYFSTYNPELWLAPPQGWGVLAGRVTDSLHYPALNLLVRVTSLDTDRRWWVYTYGVGLTINRDPYYRENFALSDLPAGEYEIYIPYAGLDFKTIVKVFPGAVTYFRFTGQNGFSNEPPSYTVPTYVPGFENQ